MSDDHSSLNIEISENPSKVCEQVGKTLIDLVIYNHRDILYMKTSNESFDLTSSLLGNEKSLLLTNENPAKICDQKKPLGC